jgi:Holliday junction resolvasome RuvABC endonuclease subunit
VAAEDNGTSRLDRIERDLQALIDAVQHLTDHVAQGDAFMAKLAAAHLQLAEAQNRLELAQAETTVKLNEATDKLNALIQFVDDQIRRPPAA